MRRTAEDETRIDLAGQAERIEFLSASRSIARANDATAHSVRIAEPALREIDERPPIR
jgi:hypothetical protein